MSELRLRDQFPFFHHNPSLHYLDNAATTQMPQCVIDAVLSHDSRARSNVSRGSYALSENTTAAYEKARDTVRRFLNAASSNEIVFTSGATASINLFAQAVGPLLRQGDEIVVSVAEHHSNLLPWQMLAKHRGLTIKAIPVDGQGVIDTTRLAECISSRCRVLSVTHCSNVTGAITDLEPIVEIARAVGAMVFVDGAQYVQHGVPDVASLGIDGYAFSGHKCFGPSGIGVLWVRENLLEKLDPPFGGGGTVEHVSINECTFAGIPRRFEAGTPPISGAIGLAAALNWLMALPRAELLQRELAWAGRMLSALRDIPGARVIGPEELTNRLPIVSFHIDGMHPHDVSHLLDEVQVCVRGGTQCAQPLHDALNVPASVRASLSLYNDDDDVLRFIDGISRARGILA
ncbi:aminotransferase class V-fold PLP-dependent enzyme [Noviherbaspirillum sp.]|uniref:aminotransferase class V-fold PLP-dependent enzyme n=1 Tax=Noviherbaspirillum sp. TaxID=1926288 RepID=UPI0025CC774E|nr:aminotransferase class V-fold PLP-dependent enzyme [Noviherbaspirillum sp.]